MEEGRAATQWGAHTHGGGGARKGRKAGFAALRPAKGVKAWRREGATEPARYSCLAFHGEENLPGEFKLLHCERGDFTANLTARENGTPVFTQLARNWLPGGRDLSERAGGDPAVG